MRGGLPITTYPKRQFSLKYRGKKEMRAICNYVDYRNVSVYVCLSMDELHSNDSGVFIFVIFLLVS